MSIKEYFSHDYHTRQDEKIKRLIVKHGMAGYGIFWGIVESLYANANAIPTQYDCIAYELHVDENIVKSIITDFGLFEVNENIFYSDSVARRLNERLEKSNKAKKSADERWEKYRLKLEEENANALQTQSKRKAKAVRPQSDGNAIKENNIYYSIKHLSLSIEEYNSILLLGYTKEQIDDKLNDIANYKKIDNYVSLNLTLQKWLKKDYPSVLDKEKKQENQTFDFSAICPEPGVIDLSKIPMR